MKVHTPGMNREGWGLQLRCSGSGNGGGGCKKQLWIEASDLFKVRDKIKKNIDDTYMTFECIECGIWTDVAATRIPLQFYFDAPYRVFKKRRRIL